MAFTGDIIYELSNDESTEDSDLLSANRLFFINQFPEAEKKYLKLLKRFDNNPDIYCRAGICSFHRGELKIARDFLDKALSLDNGHLIANKWKGNLLMKIGNPIEARRYLNHAIPLVTKELIPLIIGGKNYTNLYWPWLTDSCGKSIDKKGANKFFLACILDYMRKAEETWILAKKYTENDLGDPENLWHEIVKTSLSEWEKQNFKLHRFPVAHRNVWVIGKRIVDEYNGDVRNTWLNYSPEEITKNIFALFGKKPTDKAKLPRMILGALQDEKQIPLFPLDLAPDTHIRKVLGRMIYGSPKLTIKEALELGREIYPENPWFLDAELYTIGKDTCSSQNPDCINCEKVGVCTYGAISL